jgi:hypothetical protein
MKRRSVCHLCAAALAFVAVSGSAFGQQKTLKEQLIGKWTLTAWEQTRPDGSKLQRFGASPKRHGFDDHGAHSGTGFACVPGKCIAWAGALAASACERGHAHYRRICLVTNELDLRLLAYANAARCGCVL